MLKKVFAAIISMSLLLAITLAFSGCQKKNEDIKIGVSFGVGKAVRWAKEKEHMEQRAAELGINIEVRLNTTDEPKTQQEDCFEMIDSGIDVLILTPRDASNVSDIIEYAKSKKVKVINYARVALDEKDIDFFVGYDCEKIGHTLGQYLTETVDTGDYILLKGDPNDNNAELLYNGAMKYISEIRSDINVILDVEVENWSADVAKNLVLDAIKNNDNKVNAILAPNDNIAGACAEALEELNITEHVVITGMDAELDAVKRIVAGKQDVTIYMDLKELAFTAVDEAYHIATNQKVNINAKFNNGSSDGVQAFLITGKLITKDNVDKILIDSGYFTKEEVYGAQ